MPIEPEIQYCPYCGWNTYETIVYGNNGMLLRRYCSYCGWIGSGDDGSGTVIEAIQSKKSVSDTNLHPAWTFANSAKP